MARRERNRVVVAAVAVLILAAGVYGPIALLAPLPDTPGTAIPAPADAVVEGTGPVLPAAGSTGVTLDASSPAIAAGSTDPVPMAATAKLITALLVLERYPLTEGRPGPAIPVTADDYAAYSRYQAEGTRSVRVVTGDQWSEREALQAMLIASSNNHAEMLARWAFGSEEEYLSAAAAWLTANGLDSTRVADSTGLSPDSVGTGADLARLAAIAMADPLIAEIVATPRATTLRGVTFDNTIAYSGAQGVLGISRSYTDEAGVCLLFAYPTTISDQPVTIYGAFLGEPSYDQLAIDVNSFIGSLPSAMQLAEVVAAGTAYGTYSTAWGASSAAVASESLYALAWNGQPLPAGEVELDEVGFIRTGRNVGRITVTIGTLEQTTILTNDRAIGDPGLIWRLFNPGVVVPGFIGMLSDR
ncbi:D-alanyl-D-alanine carboxypeptidase family protein [Amnibacterium flavum]|uniref:Peptidase S11 D-alanyl-D-alanine carboxypeptidase A N-terminal domain-containing protein n=1 Tax=Amnibacterium flavum TaxID=2173173 RepID=A0A2V1HV30_9MICO|nr:serine hydrolase [Amnibacterium flavum]PVZ93954.1 hypothetical protein DDQ50_09310 [Amnibacterium flavum]